MRTNKYLKIDMQSESDLYKFIESSSKPRESRRALAVLMSNDKKSVPEIAKKIGMNSDTVYDWLINFTKYGLDGITDKPISGRPKKLRKQDEENIKEVFKKSS
jgi:transposase